MLSVSKIQTQLLQFKNFFGEFSWAAIILFSCFVLAYVFRLFLLRYENKFYKSGRFGLHAFFKAIANPIFFLFIFIGIFFGVDVIESIHIRMKDAISILKKSSFIICISWHKAKRYGWSRQKKSQCFS